MSIVGVKGGMQGLKFRSSVDDNKDLHIVVEYEQEFLFDFNGLVTFPRKMEVITHMWGL